ncbi:MULTISPECIES: hypothetical protein [Bacillaceae]|uniref:Uncharacterized protein n=1 Tax=Gottfriedia luciferensis TaxID=178774 RepID=A0ABX2ZUH2_9BACI|nr:MULTISPECIES: hypothetical protein [Bacillaceae]ODG93396.1 hypothetical protein BED47_03660 [Gottfriedia luciferensis]PGZ88779.1 hypothetical protein COE53_19490 [Bacillus sp. AFS029533]
MNYNDFNNEELWYGGYYELSIEYNPYGDNKKLNKALVALYKCDNFNGMWKERKDFQNYYETISLPINLEDASVDQFYGTVTDSKSNIFPCLISIIRIEGESDWIDISIPLVIFEEIFNCNYPLIKESNLWLNDIDKMFTTITELIYSHSPFDLAMIGEEVSGRTNQKEITLVDINKITCILPNQLQSKLGLYNQGVKLTNDLRKFD